LALLAYWFAGLLEHICHTLPCSTQVETSVPIEVIGMEADLYCFFYKAVTCYCYFFQYRDIEVDVSSFDTVFHHSRLIWLAKTYVSAVAEHSIEAGHNIDFNNITILEKVTYMDRLVKEAIKICLHPNSFSRDGGFNLSRAWQPVTNMLKQSGEPISKQGQATQAFDSAH
jgi:hypothetical protein